MLRGWSTRSQVNWHGFSALSCASLPFQLENSGFHSTDGLKSSMKNCLPFICLSTQTKYLQFKVGEINNEVLMDSTSLSCSFYAQGEKWSHGLLCRTLMRQFTFQLHTLFFCFPTLIFLLVGGGTQFVGQNCRGKTWENIESIRWKLILRPVYNSRYEL